MALQGTLDTFGLQEVLRLLSGTEKTGLLAVEGDRGVGNVWLTGGRIVSALSDQEQGDQVAAVVFDLLRFGDGMFVFEPDAAPNEPPVHDLDVDDVIHAAEKLLTEWRKIEVVVPSLDVHVQLVPELKSDAVRVTADQWRTLALVGGGTTAGHIATHYELNELDACRIVYDLVGAGLVDVSTEPGDDPVATTPSDDAGADLGEFVAEVAEQERAEAVPASANGTAPADVTTEPEPGDDAAVTGDPAPEPPSAEADDVPPADDAPAADDFLSQLANLSPKAAAAIEATSDLDVDDPAPGDDGPHDPASEVPANGQASEPGGDGDEDVNRNLLLKFLSSAEN